MIIQQSIQDLIAQKIHKQELVKSLNQQIDLALPYSRKLYGSGQSQVLFNNISQLTTQRDIAREQIKILNQWIEGLKEIDYGPNHASYAKKASTLQLIS